MDRAQAEPHRHEAIAFLSSGTPDAEAALDRLTSTYGDVDPGSGKPIYGMNRGSVGFLMNEYAEDGLHERLAAAARSMVHPLAMVATDRDGRVSTARAINEVSLLRQSSQVANLSANGPILPLDAALMALTPISAFRPRRWRGALLSDRARVTVEVLESEKRPVAATADHHEIKDVVTIEIAMDHDTGLVLLHDPGHSLDERILREQFD